MFHPSITCCYLYPITKYGYPPPAEETGRHLKEMKALGFQSVELEGIREEHLLAIYEQRHVLREQVQTLDLLVPYFCIVLPGLSAADTVTREHNLRLFEKGCEIANLLGAHGVLDNAPLTPYQFPDDIPVARHYDADVLHAAFLPPDLNWKRYWNDLAQTYRAACDIASEHGLTYQMHPCLGVLCATADGFLRFYDAVGRDNLRFTFDTANQFVQKENLALSLRRLAGHIDYIHISDNRGIRLEHLAPGDGAIAWDTFFETLNVIDFDGHLGLDIGGDESNIADIDAAYTQTARWLVERWDPSAKKEAR